MKDRLLILIVADLLLIAFLGAKIAIRLASGG